MEARRPRRRLLEQLVQLGRESASCSQAMVTSQGGGDAGRGT